MPTSILSLQIHQKSSKDKLKLAQGEELVAMKRHVDRLVAQERKSKQKQETRRKREEERNAPLPPIDGNALGAALLENLGFN